MLSLIKPSSAAIRQFLFNQAKLDFTDSAVGATAREPPPGCVVDHTRIKVGEGEHAFQPAKAALQRWDHFRLGWVEPSSPEPPIETGAVVAVLARVLGAWWLNACRIVYVIDEDGLTTRFGFAYGTLPGHAESGEERFQVEWHHTDNSVWYDIVAFSRPNHWLTRLGYPIVRLVQKRFARDSAAVMLKSVNSIDEAPIK
jgi:uncharacterized protein (UPF0548 family)